MLGLRRGGSRDRKHTNYLRGTLWCGRCQAEGRTNRMVFSRSVGNGGEYFYYFCAGTQRHECDALRVPVDLLEDRVAAFVGRCRFSAEFIDTTRALLDETLKDVGSATKLRHDQLRSELRKLDHQEENLLDLAADGNLASSKIRARLLDITARKEHLTGQLELVEADLSVGADLLRTAMTLMEHPGQLYRRVSDEHRRLLLQALFERLYVDQDDLVNADFREPFAELAAISRTFDSATAVTHDAVGSTSSGNAKSARTNRACALSRRTPDQGLVSLASGWNSAILVELGGIEPPSIRR